MDIFLEFKSFPMFFVYWAMSLILMIVFIKSYTFITKYNEFELMFAGNKAAALALSGAVVGFVLPLGVSIIINPSFPLFIFWAVVSGVFQILGYFVVKFLLKDFDAGIEAENEAYGLFKASLSVAMGIINAFCVV